MDSLKLYATSSRNEVSRMGELQFSVWAVETFAETVLTPNDLIELLGLHPRPSPLPPCCSWCSSSAGGHRFSIARTLHELLGAPNTWET